jgi:hypothetical protein
VFFEVGSGFVRVELEAQGREVHALVAGAILARAGAAGACARCPHLRIEMWGTRSWGVCRMGHPPRLRPRYVAELSLGRLSVLRLFATPT